MIEKTESYIYSTNGVNKLRIICWRPMNQVKAILQISHGMAEHIDRYDRLGTFLAAHEILVIGNDHLGHGDSVADDNELGYFPTADKSQTVVDDLYKVSKTIRAQYPELPFFLLGHSMGSFMVRRYLMTYGRYIDGAIVMGTGAQPDAAIKAGEALAKAIKIARGERFRSRQLQKMAFGSYNHRIEPLRTDYDWLSRDEEQVDLYLADAHCGFMFTVNGYETLFDVLSFIQNEDHICKLPPNVPILFLSGAEDPVGHYGKDVREICARYKKAGVKKVDMKLYEGARHELLNELEYDQVQNDILHFIYQN